MNSTDVLGFATRIVVAMAAAICVVAMLVVYFYCPCSRLPGGYLLGEVVDVPVSDWSFVNTVPLCQIEVDTGLRHSVNLNCMAGGETLYLSCSNCAGKRWSNIALNHPDARLRAGDVVYPVSLTRLEDPVELDAAWRARAQKLGIATDTIRPDGWWSFRVASR